MLAVQPRRNVNEARPGSVIFARRVMSDSFAVNTPTE
jgi:hypothetical protein